MLSTIHGSSCCSNTDVLVVLYNYRFYMGIIDRLFTFHFGNNPLYYCMVIPTI